jgi:disulfide bond formation protein DsbB
VTGPLRLLYDRLMIPKPRTAILIFLVLALAVIGFVLFSQYVQHYEPCELCLRERRPWYFVIALGGLGLIAPSRGILMLIGFTLLLSAGLGLHHAGVEQGWWQGPEACTGGNSGARTVEELRRMMESAPMVRCDEIAWKLFGLSMAAYNFLLSLAAAIAALWWAKGIRKPV